MKMRLVFVSQDALKHTNMPQNMLVHRYKHSKYLVIGKVHPNLLRKWYAKENSQWKG